MYDSMLNVTLTAIALMLVMEGILPFLSPNKFRQFMARIANQHDKAIRIMGFVTMIAGAILMYLVHHGLFNRFFW